MKTRAYSHLIELSSYLLFGPLGLIKRFGKVFASKKGLKTGHRLPIDIGA